jgi:amidase
MDSRAAAAHSSGRPVHELDFASALSAAEAIRAKRVSSLELTRHVFERIDRYNPALNAFAYQLRDEALSQAKKADEALAKGEALGVFHGVAVQVKESFAVAGRPCTWGIPAFKDSQAPRNAVVVDRLLGAGAVLIGGTNVPVNLRDWQSYNPIYGTTNNPWDLTRTPGGSSGGPAAALAAGLGFLSVGSDIGGSIRVPSNFCGTYGHKPTLDLLSLRGHQPGGTVPPPGFTTLLAVAGPMARSASDLLAALKVLGGADGWEAKAWRWDLPAPRAKNLREFRVGYVMDDPIAPPTPEVAAVLGKTIDALGRAGAKLKPGWPAGYQPKALLDTYFFMLSAFDASMAPPSAEKPAPPPTLVDPADPFAAGAVATFSEWQRANLRRLAYRAQWQAHFEEVDVFLSPAAFTTAVPHDHSEPQSARTVRTASGPRRYMEILNWIGPATLTGCPATVAPVGFTPERLPVGVQIMGPYGEDATPITFAELLAREIGGFSPPAGFAA